MPDRDLPEPRWHIYGPLVVLWLAAGLLATLRGGLTGRLFIDIGYVVLPLLGVLVALRRALLVRGKQRGGWLVFVAAFLCWAIAGLFWSLHEAAEGSPPDFPAPSDVGFIVYTVLGSVGLFLLSPRWAPRPRAYELDLAAIALAVAYALYHFVLESALDLFQADPVLASVMLAYPVADVGAVAIAVFTLSRAESGRRVQPLLVGSGFLLLAFTDAVWLYRTMHGSYESGRPFDLLWHVAFILVILGFVYRQASRTEVSPMAHGRVRYLMPIALGALLGLLVVMDASRGRLGLPEAAFLVSLLFALTIRQAIAMRNNDLLRKLVQSRADELEAANQRLARSAEEKAQFVNATAHELSNPLTPMSIHTNLLLNPEHGRDDAKRSKSVEAVQRAIARLKGLVEDLLNIGRLEAGKMKVQLRETDLAALLRDEVSFIQETASKEGLTVHLEAPERATVTTDPDRVHQILANFLSNAIKYSPTGRTIKVSLLRSGERWRAQVTDAGPGLSAEQREMLFRPFSQVQGAQTQKKGTGLGLYICRMLGERLGGEVGCDSEGVGKGATFWLELPAATGVSPTIVQS